MLEVINEIMIDGLRWAIRVGVGGMFYLYLLNLKVYSLYLKVLL